MSLHVKILTVVIFLTSSIFADDIISVNFYKDIAGSTYGKISTNSFGVALEDSVTDGWMDKLSDTHKGLALTTSDGTLSSVIIQTIRPSGNGYDTTAATNYQDTAMRGFINAYSTNTAEEAQVVLSNLNANFPNGYKIITYLGGVNQNSGASISLTEGDASEWDVTTDETYYFKTRYYPDPGSESVYSGSATSEAPSTIYVGNGTFTAPYYFFYEDVDATIPLDITDQIFYKGNTYTFERVSGVSNHPFYISDTINNNSYHNGGLSFNNTGGSSSAGIVSGGKITFTLPDDYSNELHYYCVAHASMVSANGLEIGSLNTIAGWNGTPVKATDTTSDVGPNTTVADYAVFYNLTADQVTLTLDSIQDGAAGIGGIQIVGSSSLPTADTMKAISVNLTGGAANDTVTGTYGLASHNSEFAGWYNVIDPSTSSGSYYDFSNGSTSSVQVTAVRPNGNGFDNAGSDSDNYDGTPLRGFAQAFKPYNDEVHVTLNNLNENFPNGVKVIAYLAGQSGNLGARIRLSEGGNANDAAEGWLNPNNDLGTYYYKTRWNPDAPNANGFNGALIQATSTNSALKDATTGADFDVADYAIWENITADRVTLTLDTLTINDNQQAAGLGGFQIVSEATTPTTPDSEYTTWLTTYSLAAESENLDADNDGVVNVLEYALGTDPQVANANDDTVSGAMNAGDLTLTHTVRTGLNHGLTYTVETTDDLKFGTWTSTGVSVSNIDTSGILDQITHSVSSTNDAVFLRLKVDVD